MAENSLRALNVRVPAPNTAIGYKKDWEDFETYCRREGYKALPPDEKILSAYLNFLYKEKNLKPGTLKRRLSGLNKYFMAAGFAPLHNRALRLQIQSLSLEPKNPGLKSLQKPDIRKIIKKIPGTSLRGKRDKALILLTYAAGLKRAALLELNLEDTRIDEEGLTLSDGSSGQKHLPFDVQNPKLCAVEAVREYQEALFFYLAKEEEGTRPDKKQKLFVGLRGSEENPILSASLSGQALNKIIKKYFGELYSCHSLRAGFIKEQLMRGEDMRTLAEDAGYKSPHMIYKYEKGLLSIV